VLRFLKSLWMPGIDVAMSQNLSRIKDRLNIFILMHCVFITLRCIPQCAFIIIQTNFHFDTIKHLSVIKKEGFGRPCEIVWTKFAVFLSIFSYFHFNTCFMMQESLSQKKKIWNIASFHVLPSQNHSKDTLSNYAWLACLDQASGQCFWEILGCSTIGRIRHQ
jgi:hypothetical protein